MTSNTRLSLVYSSQGIQNKTKTILKYCIFLFCVNNNTHEPNNTMNWYTAQGTSYHVRTAKIQIRL